MINMDICLVSRLDYRFIVIVVYRDMLVQQLIDQAIENLQVWDNETSEE